DTIRLFFFFQAEDGIRDLIVTGVQTCALPISRDREGRPGAARRRAGRAQPVAQPRARDGAARGGPRSGASGRAPPPADEADEGRSEERRVGKEGRAGWQPDEYRKREQCMMTVW